MWNWLKALFTDKESIAWARLQAVIGALAVAVTYVEPAVLQPILPPGWFPWLLVANGVLSEYLRRRRASDL